MCQELLTRFLLVGSYSEMLMPRLCSGTLATPLETEDPQLAYFGSCAPENSEKETILRIAKALETINCNQYYDGKVAK